MIVAIHQPNFLPWPGYFYKMLRCDVFVLLDDAQYTKNSFINRNRIKTPQGELWLTVPASPKLGTAIHDVEVKDGSWPTKMFKTLSANYGRSKYFDDIMEPLQTALLERPHDLCGTNIAALNLISGWLNTSCKIVKASAFPTDTTGDQRLVQLVKAVGGAAYLSGYGGRNYQSEDTFLQAGITCDYYDFQPPRYPQLWGGFIPGLSIVDCLFNCGTEEAGHLLRRSGTKSL